jgi:hypothetical protein
MASKDYNINAIYRTIGAEQMVKANKAIAGSFTEIHQMGRKTVAVSGYIDDVGNRMATTMRIAEDHRQRFKMYYLSIMFGGMMLQRTFGKIEQSAVSTFMKITEGQTSAGQAVSALSAHWEYLKFSIGDAIATSLEPLLPYLIDLITFAADFTEQHPELVFMAIAGAITAGTFLAAIGQVGLFMQGLSMWRASPDFKELSSGDIFDKIAKVAGTVFIIKGVFEMAKELVTGKIDPGQFAAALSEATGGALLFSPHPAAKAIGVALILIPKLFPQQWEDTINAISDFFYKLFFKLGQDFRAWIDQIRQYIYDAFPWLVMAAKILAGGTTTIGNLIPGFQEGGIVPRTGLIYAHQGETVIPKGEGMVSITYNVTGNNISSAVDLKQALREHNDEIMNTLKSYGISR